MKVEHVKKDNFRPVEIRIVLETPQELAAIHLMSKMDATIPETVEKVVIHGYYTALAENITPKVANTLTTDFLNLLNEVITNSQK